MKIIKQQIRNINDLFVQIFYLRAISNGKEKKKFILMSMVYLYNFILCCVQLLPLNFIMVHISLLKYLYKIRFPIIKECLLIIANQTQYDINKLEKKSKNIIGKYEKI